MKSPTRTRPPRLKIAAVRPQEHTAFLNLIAHAAPGDRVFTTMTHKILVCSRPEPLSHGVHLCLLARDGDSLPVGALVAGPPAWILRHPSLTVAHRQALMSRVAIINGLAVAPDHRRTGVARALVRTAERTFAHQGAGLMTIDHHPELDSFYNRLGYTAGDALAVNTPGGVITAHCPGLRISAKPMEARVTFGAVPGTSQPVVGGLLPHSRI